MVPRAQTLASIQYARALAAFAVVYAHLDHVANNIIGDPGVELPPVLRFGHAGVDLFFVISGFVIALITSERRFDSVTFAERRFVRIVPFYWFWTLAFVALAHMQTTRVLYDPQLLAPSFALIPQAEFPVLAVGWSLEHEIIFYVLGGLTLWLGRSMLLTFGACVVAGMLIHVAYPAWTGETLWDRHVFSLYQVEFLFGLLVFRFRAVFLRIDYRVALVVGALGFAATAHVVGSKLLPGISNQMLNEGPLGLLRVIGFGGSSVLVVGGLLAAEQRGALERVWRPLHRLLLAVGDASYSLYLSHLLVFGVSGKIYGWLGVPEIALAPALIGAVAIAVLWGVLWFRFVEKPVLAYLQGLLQRIHR